MAPAACRPVIKGVKCGCTGACPLSVVEYGYQAGKKPARCRTCGTTFPRPNVTLSVFLPSKRKETRNRSQTASPAVSRRSLGVSWSDSPRERTEPREDVMEDCTESHQSEINRKIKANDNLRNILTSLPEEHRALMYGDSVQSKMNSLDDEKTALLAAKRQRLPLRCQVEKQNIYLERLTKDVGEQQLTRLEMVQKWIEADQELESANAKQTQGKMEMAALVAEQAAENANAVNQELPRPIHERRVPCQTKWHSNQSSL